MSGGKKLPVPEVNAIIHIATPVITIPVMLKCNERITNHESSHTGQAAINVPMFIDRNKCIIESFMNSI